MRDDGLEQSGGEKKRTRGPKYAGGQTQSQHEIQIATNSL